jgi:hypothetical protein
MTECSRSASLTSSSTNLKSREKLVRGLAAAEAPVEDFSEKIGRLKTQFNPANTEIAIRKLIFLARNNGDEQAKRRLMPIVRDLIQTGRDRQDARPQAGSPVGSLRYRQHHGFDGCDRRHAAAVCRVRPERCAGADCIGRDRHGAETQKAPRRLSGGAFC